MATTIDIHDLPARLEEAVRLASEGQEILIADEGTPRAKLIPLERAAGARVPGLHAGMVDIADDFDAPLPDDFWLGRE
jgi:antitoxin (DNA-binding transcriptional repressor) of toxin-antitoxin stability system